VVACDGVYVGACVRVGDVCVGGSKAGDGACYVGAGRAGFGAGLGLAGAGAGAGSGLGSGGGWVSVKAAEG